MHMDFCVSSHFLSYVCHVPELSEILVEHLVPGVAAEAALQHPLPCPGRHQQWQIDLV